MIRMIIPNWLGSKYYILKSKLNWVISEKLGINIENIRGKKAVNNIIEQHKNTRLLFGINNVLLLTTPGTDIEIKFGNTNLKYSKSEDYGTN